MTRPERIMPWISRAVLLAALTVLAVITLIGLVISFFLPKQQAEAAHGPASPQQGDDVAPARARSL